MRRGRAGIRPPRPSSMQRRVIRSFLVCGGRQARLANWGMTIKFRSLPAIAAMLVCLLLDISTPFGGAFHLEPAGHWVQASTWAASEPKAPAVVRERILEFIASVVDATLPDGPVSARTPAARPPPAL